MTAQNILLILGIITMAASLVCAVIAAYIYRRDSIRAVMDDLSGKTRQHDLGSAAPKKTAARQQTKPIKSRLARKGRLEKASSADIAGEKPTSIMDGSESATSLMEMGEGNALDDPTAVIVAGILSSSAIFDGDRPTTILDDNDSPTTVLGAGKGAIPSEGLRSIQEPADLSVSPEASDFSVQVSEVIIHSDSLIEF